MNKVKDFIKNHQQQIVLVIGYIAVAGLAFGLGKYGSKPVVPVSFQAVNPPVNYNPNISSTQTETVSTTGKEQLDCQGKIKGSSSMIYHIPGGSFYKKTTKPIRCFDTEAQARAAGFRKSAR